MPTQVSLQRMVSYKDVGTTSPPHILGLTAEAKYKGFRLAATAEYRNGHYIYNAIALPLTSQGRVSALRGIIASVSYSRIQPTKILKTRNLH
jgi:hypothetical protein